MVAVKMQADDPPKTSGWLIGHLNLLFIAQMNQRQSCVMELVDG